jgi:hypothetical protein
LLTCLFTQKDKNTKREIADFKVATVVSAQNQISEKQVGSGSIELYKGLAAGNMKPLPGRFIPGHNAVLCGRRTKCSNHVGNKRFRRMVRDSLKEYANASDSDKTYIISDIIRKVRQNSANGGFVMKEPLSGLYVEVGDLHAVRTSVEQ